MLSIFSFASDLKRATTLINNNQQKTHVDIAFLNSTNDENELYFDCFNDFLNSTNDS